MNLHLRVKDASLRFNNANGAVVGVDGEETAFTVGDHGSQRESEVLGVHLGGKTVAQTLLLASGNIDAVPSGSQVANQLALLIQGRQSTANEVDSHRRSFIVGEGNQCLRGVAIDKLHAEDLRSRERCFSGDSEGRRLSFFSLLSILCNE